MATGMEATSKRVYNLVTARLHTRELACKMEVTRNLSPKVHTQENVNRKDYTMRYTFLTGDVNWQKYGGKFISLKQNNGDWDYYLILSVTNMHEATGDENQPKYNVSVQAVSPQAAGKANTDTAMGACGFLDEQLARYQNDPIVQAECLSDYGIFAQLWTGDGNNVHELMKQARKESDLIVGLFGFYMDRPGNGIGQTGWNLIAGQDIRTFFGMK